MSALSSISVQCVQRALLQNRVLKHTVVNSLLPCQPYNSIDQARYVKRLFIHTSTASHQPAEVDHLTKNHGLQDSLYGFLDKHLGITIRDKYRWKDLKVASHVLLNSIYMKVDHSAIRKHANLEDSFESWLKIVYMHVWMLLVKLKQHGRDGKILSKCIVQILWQDINERANKIQKELEQHLEIRKQMKDYYQLLISSFVFFDEGLLKGDAMLAGSLWNLIFGGKNVEPQNLECLIHYVRFTVARLDDVPLEHLVLDPENMKWPLPEKFGSYD